MLTSLSCLQDYKRTNHLHDLGEYISTSKGNFLKLYRSKNVLSVHRLCLQSTDTKLWSWGFSSTSFPFHLTDICKQHCRKRSKSRLLSYFLIQHKQQGSGMSAKPGLTSYQLLLRSGTSTITAAFSFYTLEEEGRHISTFHWHVCFSFARHTKVLLKIHWRN